MSKSARTYLVIVRVSEVSPKRLRKLVPELILILSDVSMEEPEYAFRAVQADILGFLIKSKLRAENIKAYIESPGDLHWDFGDDPPKRCPVFSDDDSLMVIEIGEEFCFSKAFSRQQSWLQLR